jgi:hypothetical protein
MNAGVATLPREVINSPALAKPSVWSNRKEKLKEYISHKGYAQCAPIPGPWAYYVILSESGSRLVETLNKYLHDSNQRDCWNMLSPPSTHTQQSTT